MYRKRVCLSVRVIVKTYLQSPLIFCKTTDIFYATKENNVAQF